MKDVFFQGQTLNSFWWANLREDLFLDCIYLLQSSAKTGHEVGYLNGQHINDEAIVSPNRNAFSKQV